VKRFRFRLLSLMIVVAMTALAAWGYAIKRRSAEFASKADQYAEDIFELTFLFPKSIHYDESILPIGDNLTKTPQVSERQLRHLEDFYRYVLTESDVAERRLTKSEHARQMLRVLWIRYKVHMYFKYRRAAARPWFPVDPDPPAPLLDPYSHLAREWWRDGELRAKIAEYSKTFRNRVPE
jgi:hypothetical protein